MHRPLICRPVNVHFGLRLTPRLSTTLQKTAVACYKPIITFLTNPPQHLDFRRRSIQPASPVRDRSDWAERPPADPPPSPPIEGSKHSLPSISNLISLADAGLLTTEASPAKLSPRNEGKLRNNSPLTSWAGSTDCSHDLFHLAGTSGLAGKSS